MSDITCKGLTFPGNNTEIPCFPAEVRPVSATSWPRITGRPLPAFGGDHRQPGRDACSGVVGTPQLDTNSAWKQAWTICFGLYWVFKKNDSDSDVFCRTSSNYGFWTESELNMKSPMERPHFLS